jgi:hypothetical protein
MHVKYLQINGKKATQLERIQSKNEHMMQIN